MSGFINKRYSGISGRNNYLIKEGILMRTAKLSPSLFAANIFDMKSQIEILQNNNVDLLHLDVMDGNFVSRMAFGADHIRMLKESTNIPLDVHMMVMNPEKHLDAVIAAEADIITIHQEATNCLYHCLQTIKKAGKKAGVVLSPATHPANIEYVLDVVDMILIMTVNPGEGGQKFLPDMLNKIRQVYALVKNRDIDIEVDGSIDDETAVLCQKAGANVFVSGGYIFNNDIEQQVIKLQQVLKIKR